MVLVWGREDVARGCKMQLWRWEDLDNHEGFSERRGGARGLVVKTDLKYVLQSNLPVRIIVQTNSLFNQRYSSSKTSSDTEE
jgi:hypothetical protein